MAYSQRRVHGGLRSRVLEGPAALWKAWSLYDRLNRQSVNRDDDNANTVVKQAARGKRQRSFFRTFEFGIKQLGPAHDGIGFCMIQVADSYVYYSC